MNPEDIQKAEFAVAVRGYSREEVEEFLSAVSQEQRVLLDELESAKRQAEQTYLALGDEIGGLLQHAKDVADGMVKKAEEEVARVREESRRSAERSRKEAEGRAGRIIQAAKQEADECIAEARSKVTELQESEGLSRERLQDLRKMAQSISDEIRQAESKPPVSRRPEDKHSAIADEGPAAVESQLEKGKDVAPIATDEKPEAADLTAGK